MDIAINSVIKYASNSENPTLEVVLWIESETNLIVTFQLYNNNSIPQVKQLSDVVELLHSNDISIIPNPNFRFIDENTIPERYKQIRNDRWNLIKDIVLCEPDIYMKNKRGNIIKKLMLENNLKQHNLIYRNLRLYWEGGKTFNSLLPNYSASGGKGKDRASGELKRGRPSSIKEGINITDDIKSVIRKSYEKFYNNSNEFPLTKAYQKMLENYFIDGYYTNEQNVLVPLIKKDGIPSLRQFSYWGKKMFSTKEIMIARKGRRNFELNHRSILG